MREQGFVGAALSQGWHRAGNRRSTNVPKEEKKSREEKLELNVVMSAREGEKNRVRSTKRAPRLRK